MLGILKNNRNGILHSFFDKAMEELYQEYLNSTQFEKSIKDLRKEGNYYDYIYNYIDVAKNFVDFFNKDKKVNEEKED